MYKWDPSLSGNSIAMDLQNPIYGFQCNKNTATRPMAGADADGFSQFQPTLLDHRNESWDVEYNPIDVFTNAAKIKAANPKRRQAKPAKKTQNTRTGYLLYTQEMYPIVQRRNPDMVFGELTKMVAQMWNELSAVEQDDFCQRAKLASEAGADDQAQDIGQPEMYGFGIGQNTGHGDEVALGLGDPSAGGLYNMTLGGQFNA